jgi:uncharacterized protein YvpB
MGAQAGRAVSATDELIRPRSRRERLKRRKSARRRGLAVLVAIPALVAGGLGVYLGASGQKPRSTVTAEAGEVALVISGREVATIPLDRASRVSSGRGDLPVEPVRKVADGPLTQTLAVDTELLRDRLAAAPAEGGAVEVPERVVASRIRLPIVQQAYRNNCETAALSMLLAAAGVERDQTELQEKITKARPLDPTTNAAGETVWGDPAAGYVGRVNGGGPGGGFGAYEGPVAALASRWADPVDLSGRKPGAVYRRLLEGRPVMTWIGLSDGPYETWTSPGGAEVTINFGEHTVVLTGVKGDRVFVNDPIDGVRKVWTKAEFEAKWDLLDRRAISL